MRTIIAFASLFFFFSLVSGSWALCQCKSFAHFQSIYGGNTKAAIDAYQQQKQNCPNRACHTHAYLYSTSSYACNDAQDFDFSDQGIEREMLRQRAAAMKKAEEEKRQQRLKDLEQRIRKKFELRKSQRLTGSRKSKDRLVPGGLGGLHTGSRSQPPNDISSSHIAPINSLVIIPNPVPNPISTQNTLPDK